MSILKLYKVAIASSNYIRNTSPQSHILRKMSFCSWIKEEEYRDHFQAGMYDSLISFIINFYYHVYSIYTPYLAP